jgi:phage shock protein A
MNVNIQTLLALIGGKEVDLLLVRTENEDLRKKLSEAETRIAELEKPKEQTVVP